MSIALIMPERNPRGLASAIRAIDQGIRVECWPHIGDPDQVRMAVAWHQPGGALSAFPNLEIVSSFGAGVDGLLADPDLPAGVAVARIVYPGLVAQMSEYVVAAWLAWRRRFWEFAREQSQGRWTPRPHRAGDTVGVMGLGELGRDSAARLAGLGYRVLGWSRTPKDLPGVEGFTGEAGLADMAGQSDCLVCLLPLTAQTRGILCAPLFEAVRPGCFLINAGRGAHLVEADLIPALDAGCLGGACLDVFGEEPLPADHPFWGDARIHVTPHVASMTDENAAAEHIVEDWRRIRDGRPPAHPVSRERGY